MQCVNITTSSLDASRVHATRTSTQLCFVQDGSLMRVLEGPANGPTDCAVTLTLVCGGVTLRSHALAGMPVLPLDLTVLFYSQDLQMRFISSLAVVSAIIAACGGTTTDIDGGTDATIADTGGGDVKADGNPTDSAINDVVTVDAAECTPPNTACMRPCPPGTYCLRPSGPVSHDLGCTSIPALSFCSVMGPRGRNFQARGTPRFAGIRDPRKRECDSDFQAQGTPVFQTEGTPASDR